MTTNSIVPEITTVQIWFSQQTQLCKVYWHLCTRLAKIHIIRYSVSLYGPWVVCLDGSWFSITDRLELSDLSVHENTEKVCLNGTCRDGHCRQTPVLPRLGFRSPPPHGPSPKARTHLLNPITDRYLPWILNQHSDQIQGVSINMRIK